ncbi:hypothetical protein U1Q18_006664 [Sarracenia purpurea var. burkii]
MKMVSKACKLKDGRGALAVVGGVGYGGHEDGEDREDGEKGFWGEVMKVSTFVVAGFGRKGGVSSMVFLAKAMKVWRQGFLATIRICAMATKVVGVI